MNIPRTLVHPASDSPIRRDYALTRLLGAGGQGRVYVGTHLPSGDAVAVKVIDVATEQQRESVRREAGILRRLAIRGIAQIREYIEFETVAWIVMELAEGPHFPTAQQPVSWEELAPMVATLLGTLTRAHTLGFIHRDLKPANVICTETGPVLVDFGISMELQPTGDTGPAFGSPRFAPASQRDGGQPTAEWDLYGLAVMVVEALTGEHWLREKQRDVLRALDDRAPQAVSTSLTAILRHQVERPTTADALTEAMGLDRRHADLRDRLAHPGQRALLDRAVGRLRRGESLRVAAAPGVDRSGFLTAVGRRLRHRALVLRATDVQLVALGAAPNRDALRRRVARLMNGRALVVLGRPAPRHRRLLRALADLPIAFVDEHAPHITLPPFSASDLRELFRGSSAFNLPERAGQLLYSRTYGMSRPVQQELARWLRRGVVRKCGLHLHVRPCQFEAEEHAALPEPPPRPPGPSVPTDLQQVLHVLALCDRPMDAEILAAILRVPRLDAELLITEAIGMGLVVAEEQGAVVVVGGDPTQVGPAARAWTWRVLSQHPMASREDRLRASLLGGDLARALTSLSEFEDHPVRSATAHARVAETFAPAESVISTVFLERWAAACVAGRSASAVRGFVRFAETHRACEPMLHAVRAVDTLLQGQSGAAADALSRMPRPVTSELRDAAMALTREVASRSAAGTALPKPLSWLDPALAQSYTACRDARAIGASLDHRLELSEQVLACGPPEWLRQWAEQERIFLSVAVHDEAVDVYPAVTALLACTPAHDLHNQLLLRGLRAWCQRARGEASEANLTATAWELDPIVAGPRVAFLETAWQPVARSSHFAWMRRIARNGPIPILRELAIAVLETLGSRPTRTFSAQSRVAVSRIRALRGVDDDEPKS